jgi:serine/threonine protein phosphatase PrpC
MTRSSDVAPPVAEADVGGWHLAVAAVRGASHEADRRPMQDAFRWEAPVSAAGPCLVLALADGHGHERHPRSARGALAAVEVCCEVIGGAGEELAATPTTALPALLDDRLIPEAVGRWRTRVLEDLAKDPLPASSGPIPTDDPVISYGSTLIGAYLTSSRLVLLQIGDGDVVVVRPDGSSWQPIPGDDRLVHQYTTSLCQPDATLSFRHAVVEVDTDPAQWILLATDGFANAQSDASWRHRLGFDLDDLAARHGPRWPASQLGQWAARCASGEGSGDDVTVALVGGP